MESKQRVVVGANVPRSWLTSRGLVTREAHPRDRRARIVRLTAAGKEQAAKTFAGHKADYCSGLKTHSHPHNPDPAPDSFR